MKEKTARNLFEFSRDSAKTVFDQCGQLMPVFFIETDDRFIPIGVPWSNHREKAQAIQAIGATAKAQKAMRVATIIEIWMGKQYVDTSKPFVRPNDLDPAERDEGIIVMVRTNVTGEKNLVGRWEIQRKVNTKPRAVNFQEFDADTFHTIFEAILPPKILN